MEWGIFRLAKNGPSEMLLILSLSPIHNVLSTIEVTFDQFASRGHL